MTHERIIIRGDLTALADIAALLPKVLTSYQTDPGENGGGWYGRGVGLKSLVIYTVNKRYVEVYRTKTAIVLYIAERVKE